jgi:integral membrane protein (TIGR01906 family)
MKKFHPLFGYLVVLIIPFFLMITSVRILISPWYPQFEYRTPNFPSDTYGFTLQDRLKWSKVSMEYLVNSSDISFLGDLQFPDGTSLYKPSELSHMEDVKKVVGGAFTAWWVMLVILGVTGVWAWRINWFSAYLRALARGGWLTIGVIVAILVGVAISFRDLFTDFHRIFFTGNSWLFLFSDTLIRLFPMHFWQDAFIWMGVFTLLGAGILIFIDKKFSTKVN